MRSDCDRLLDILEAIEKIEKYAGRGETAFQQDELIQTWVIHHLEIIGEAAGRVSVELREAHEEIHWQAIIAFRNILVHEYFGIDQEAVWMVVDKDLPKLKNQIKELLSK